LHLKNPGGTCVVFVFGDVHIGSRHSRLQELRSCLKRLSPDEVVVTGDLFDDQYRRVSRDEALRLIKKAMEILQIQPQRLYIVAAYLIDLIKRGQIGVWLRRRLALGNDVWLLYGHSHVPHVDERLKILNPGPWKVYGVRRIRGDVYQLPSAKPLCQPDL
jgi:predicted phosphodiesterase